MHKKIVHSFLMTFLISFTLGFGLLYVSLYKASIAQDRGYLFDTVKLIKNLEIDELNRTRLGDTFKSEGIRITIIKRDGKVLYDNYKGKITEKHLQREEVKQAIAEGTGTCIRHSDTMQRSYLYVADYESDNQTIVRLAMPFDGLSQSISILLAPFIFSICISFMVVFILSKRMADEIVEPFQDITNTINSTNISEDVLSFDKYDYPELYKITDALTNMSMENKKYLERLGKEKKVRQEFFSNASHELKTPLTSIRGYTELIRSHTIQDSAQIDTCLDCVLKESDHMTQLINDILTISKLETEEMQVTYSHIQVKKLLDSVVETLKPQIEEMDLNVYVNATDFTVFASLDHIKGIFYNLISNAIKYNKSNGRIDIELKKNQKNMYFSVEDTGIGIAKKDQERIFQRFYRVDKQRSKTIPGTGLGLSIVKHVVYYYEGKVHLTSKENIGTKIVVELPIIVKEIPEN